MNSDGGTPSRSGASSAAPTPTSSAPNRAELGRPTCATSQATSAVAAASAAQRTAVARASIATMLSGRERIHPQGLCDPGA